jgi:hypothetical protein
MITAPLRSKGCGAENRKHRFCCCTIVASESVAAGTCLPNRCLETAWYIRLSLGRCIVTALHARIYKLYTQMAGWTATWYGPREAWLLNKHLGNMSKGKHGPILGSLSHKAMLLFRGEESNKRNEVQWWTKTSMSGDRHTSKVSVQSVSYLPRCFLFFQTASALPVYFAFPVLLISATRNPHACRLPETFAVLVFRKKVWKRMPKKQDERWRRSLRAPPYGGVLCAQYSSP